MPSMSTGCRLRVRNGNSPGTTWIFPQRPCELDHPMRGSISAAALRSDERRTARSKYLHGDETRIQVIDEPDQKGSTQNWMWVYLTDESSGSPQMVLFQYERTRAGYHPKEFLGNLFEGYFTCDGYQAYHSLPDGITVTGCMAHARRRFDEALTVLKKDFTKEQLKRQPHIRQWHGSGYSTRSRR